MWSWLLLLLLRACISSSLITLLVILSWRYLLFFFLNDFRIFIIVFLSLKLRLLVWILCCGRIVIVILYVRVITKIRIVFMLLLFIVLIAFIYNHPILVLNWHKCGRSLGLKAHYFLVRWYFPIGRLSKWLLSWDNVGLEFINVFLIWSFISFILWYFISINDSFNSYLFSDSICLDWLFIWFIGLRH